MDSPNALIPLYVTWPAILVLESNKFEKPQTFVMSYSFGNGEHFVTYSMGSYLEDAMAEFRYRAHPLVSTALSSTEEALTRMQELAVEWKLKLASPTNKAVPENYLDFLYPKPRSLETWEAEFFPYSTEILLLAKRDDMTQLEAALLKWQGLRPENLAKHGVRKLTGVPYNYEIRDAEDSLVINHFTCSLCQAHPECESCPLVERNANCCEASPLEDDAPYVQWRTTGNPELMIQRIERALAKELQ